MTLFKWLSDLQLGNEKVTLNHLVKDGKGIYVNTLQPDWLCLVGKNPTSINRETARASGKLTWRQHSLSRNGPYLAKL